MERVPGFRAETKLPVPRLYTKSLVYSSTPSWQSVAGRFKASFINPDNVPASVEICLPSFRNNELRYFPNIPRYEDRIEKALERRQFRFLP